MENNVERKHRNRTEQEDDEAEFWSFSDSEIENALDCLDRKEVEEGSWSFTLSSRRPNAHGGHHRQSSTLQPRSNRNQNYRRRTGIPSVEECEERLNVGMSNSVITEIRKTHGGMATGKTKTRDKADRATVENAIDYPKRFLLFKMMNIGFFHDIHGCISTGKEANVYHATKSDGQELAIKIYKTSVLNYKRDRCERMCKDNRFSRRGCKGNPRHMVKIWAEKEMRNLMRLQAEGIRCPAPYHLGEHILVMKFIGKSGWAAPRLKDADLSLDKFREGYVEIVMAMRTLYQKCKLVHADLSEYNILYFEGHMYIIDVSQAVVREHDHALDFLREDCVHISEFFKKRGVAVMSIRELFDFIVDACIVDDAVDSYLEEMQQKCLSRGDVSVEDEIADSVFVQSFIPKTLEDVRNAEEDVQRITSGKDTKDLNYQTITGLKHVLSLAQRSENKRQQQKSSPTKDSPVISDDKSSLLENDAEDEDGRSDSEEYLSLESEVEESPVDKKAARKEARKENKKKVKQEKREVRKNKVPKAVKKRKKKLAKAPKTR